MSDFTNPMPPNQIVKIKQWSSRVILSLAIIIHVITIIVFVLLAVYAVQWFRTPFVGVLVENNLNVSAVGPVHYGSWNGVAAGLTYQDRIVAMDEKPIHHIREYVKALRELSFSDDVVLTVRTIQGELRDVAVQTQSFPIRDLFNLWAIPYLVGIVILTSGLWILILRRTDTYGLSFSVFAASLAISIAGNFDCLTTNQLTYIRIINLGIAGSALTQFTLIFPEEIRWIRRWPYLTWVGYGLAILFAGLGLPSFFVFENPDAKISFWHLEIMFFSVAILLFLVLTTVRRFKSHSPIVRQQSTVMLWGVIGAFAPLSIWFFIEILIQRSSIFSPILLLPVVSFPVSIVYAILRYKQIDTDYIFRRVILYTLFTGLTTGGYALLVGGASLLFGEVIPANNPYLIGLMIVFLALLFDPVRTRMQRLIDRIFFHGEQVHQERIQQFTDDILPTMGLSGIAQVLRSYVQEILEPVQGYLFVLDSLRDQYISAEAATGKPTSDIQFDIDSPIPRLLSSEKNFIYLPENGEINPSLLSEKDRIALLGVQLFIPLPGRTGQVVGFLALTAKLTGESYSNSDLKILQSLCDQAALAIERTQVVSDLERRVNEMNVLIRIAQGINITQRFDDILELIFAQSTRIIPTKDFWIMLVDRENEVYRYVFYLENDLRLLQYENQPMVGDLDMAQEVIRTTQTIVTSDFVNESKQRGFSPKVDNLYAWVGVPLNAGAESIGALSLGSRDPATVFSREQVEFLQAIADQAAGAIVKARLLDDSERRARQLNLLNEVAKSLTSTLELTSLLDQILENAIDIIACEAGTLFLVDERTGELIFEVVKGPVAKELQGKRLPTGTGHVGHSVETGQAAIVNEVDQTAEWARRPDQQTGFKTRDLLLVPMCAQEQVIGVIEVINRRDGLPFTLEDQEFLSAFTSQAAIALENARLYTLTDQQLAERVDELSVMQRIDRDLNASLDISRAMRITLDWAMRHSSADAGLVGAMTDDGIQLMADQGYGLELDPFRGSLFPIELPGIQQAVSNKTIFQFSFSNINEQPSEKICLLEGAQNQIVIPIQREDQVIGLLLLESKRSDLWMEKTQDFLFRLTDHAAIAIANAQLFVQVQEADLAKSEFVSFVSHELKTPMTSIRGYTDLLLAGAVGEINEAQENFLGTVKTNVNRMATLVSDLADVSRIESGRLRLEFAAVGIKGIVDEVIRSQGTGLDEKQHTLKLQIPDALMPVWGDRARIIQIMANLLSNADKYTPEGGVITIKATQTNNQWDLEGASEVALIEVQDTGIGMTEEDQTQVFTKFFRSSEPKAREAPGTGLGLNITRNLVEMQGGKIWFISEFGEGTTFFFTIPIAHG